MVGLQSRNRCHNCRRRKIKCDGGRPGCGQCLQRSKSCEGYPEAITFLGTPAHNTQTVDRKRLATRKESMTVMHSKRAFSKSCDQCQSPSDCVDSSYRAASRRWPSPARLTKEPSMSWLRSYDTILGDFLDNCFPSRAATEIPLSWLRSLMTINKSIDALPLAMSALAVGWAGHVGGREDLVNQGLQIYSFASSQLRKDVPHPGQTQFLATVVVLALYELFEFGTDGNRGWICHAAGITSSLKALGPIGVAEPLCLKIFTFVRTLFMLQSLKNRKRACAASAIWMNVPFEAAKKSKYHQLLDFGLTTGLLLEQADRLLERQHNTCEGLPDQEAMALVQIISAVLKEMKTWEIDASIGLRNGQDIGAKLPLTISPCSYSGPSAHGYPSRVSHDDNTAQRYDQLQVVRTMHFHRSVMLSLYTTLLDNSCLRAVLENSDASFLESCFSNTDSKNIIASLKAEGTELADDITRKGPTCLQGLWQMYGSLGGRWTLSAAMQWYRSQERDLSKENRNSNCGEGLVHTYQDMCQAQIDKLEKHAPREKMLREFQQSAFGDVEILAMPWCLMDLSRHDPQKEDDGYLPA